MNSDLQHCIDEGKLILFLGAGASFDSTSSDGKPLPLGNDLARMIATKAGYKYNNEPLKKVISPARKKLGVEFDKFIESLFVNCKPSVAYEKIAKYTWPRIYTTNIDDALDLAVKKHSNQTATIKTLKSRIDDQDPLYSKLNIIKLNGSADRLNEGIIFSTEEYAQGTATELLWYRELASDFHRFSFLFIGTMLDEPILYHHIERYKFESKELNQKSFIITPSASEIEKDDFENYNLFHISGTIDDFAKWLESTYPIPRRPIEVAISRNPALALISTANKEEAATLLKDVVAISRSNLIVKAESEKAHGIRDFYKGYKARWIDVIDDVPAVTSNTLGLFKLIDEIISTKKTNILAILGAAGSGKSTLLKQASLMIADKHNLPVYFMEFPPNDFEKAIEYLESSHNNTYFIIYDKVGDVARDIRKVLDKKTLNKGILICCETLRAWNKRVIEHVSIFNPAIYETSLINENDAKLILDKLQLHGPWTRLATMTPQGRLHELVTKSKRQLLIGLLETTLGQGFEDIISAEYSDISGKEENLLFILVGLATIHGLNVNRALISRSLVSLGVTTSVESLVSQLPGIVSIFDDQLQARHPLYVRHIFKFLVNEDVMHESIVALLKAFTVYEDPVYSSLNSNDFTLFKKLLNHKFVKDIFKSNYNAILDIYSRFEKAFESDGMYWLQYGLALRDAGHQSEAYNKLRTAIDSTPSPTYTTRSGSTGINISMSSCH